MADDVPEHLRARGQLVRVLLHRARRDELRQAGGQAGGWRSDELRQAAPRRRLPALWREEESRLLLGASDRIRDLDMRVCARERERKRERKRERESRLFGPTR